MRELSPLAVARSLLTREKQKDYRNTVILQIVILVVQLLMEDLFKLAGWAPPMGFFAPSVLRTLRTLSCLLMGPLY